MTDTNKTQELGALRDKVKDVRIAMVTTLTEGKRLVSRPMAAQEMGEDGTLWFLTSAQSKKIQQIEMNPEVGVAFSDPGSECYVSITGKAKITNNREQILEFWNPFYKAWFEGPEDPTIRIVEIETSAAEYWDTKGGKIVSLLSMAASAVTGKDLEVGENEKITLE